MGRKLAKSSELKHWIVLYELTDTMLICQNTNCKLNTVVSTSTSVWNFYSSYSLWIKTRIQCDAWEISKSYFYFCFFSWITAIRYTFSQTFHRVWWVLDVNDDDDDDDDDVTNFCLIIIAIVVSVGLAGNGNKFGVVCYYPRSDYQILHKLQSRPFIFPFSGRVQVLSWPCEVRFKI